MRLSSLNYVLFRSKDPFHTPSIQQCLPSMKCPTHICRMNQSLSFPRCPAGKFTRKQVAHWKNLPAKHLSSITADFWRSCPLLHPGTAQSTYSEQTHCEWMNLLHFYPSVSLIFLAVTQGPPLSEIHPLGVPSFCTESPWWWLLAKPHTS